MPDTTNREICYVALFAPLAQICPRDLIENIIVDVRAMQLHQNPKGTTNHCVREKNTQYSYIIIRLYDYMLCTNLMAYVKKAHISILSYLIFF